jgi:hypothetical protein
VTGNIICLADARVRRRGWSKRELAHFQRAANILLNAGMAVETDTGVSDEGDPWFVFCDADSGDVFAHFAKLHGTFVVSAPLMKRAITGRVFADLIETFLDHGVDWELASVSS